jgi:hypothetical protein
MPPVNRFGMPKKFMGHAKIFLDNGPLACYNEVYIWRTTEYPKDDDGKKDAGLCASESRRLL